MSSHVRHTPLQPPDAERVETTRNARGAGVKVTDPDGLEDALSDTIVDKMDTRESVDREEYPGREWTLLLGFTTWGRDEDDPVGGADYHNVSNTDAEDMADHWATVSEYTEPLVVYQTTFEGSWPHAAEVDGEREGRLYRLEARDGNVEMERLTIDVVDREVAYEVGGGLGDGAAPAADAGGVDDAE